MKTATISNEKLSLTVAYLGASVVALTDHSQNEAFEILRHWALLGETTFAESPPSLMTQKNDSGDSGLFVMAPFANRIRNNCFLWQGQTIQLPSEPSSDLKHDQPFFLHGNAWFAYWQLSEQSEHKLTWQLESSLYDKTDKLICHYQATLCYCLVNEHLLIKLSIQNLGGNDFPFGGGFHPFFNTTEGSQLQFNADGYWNEDALHLPTNYSKIKKQQNRTNKITDRLDFNTLKEIDADWINNGYDHWTGQALLVHPSLNRRIEISSNLNYLQLYQPNNQDKKNKGSFICIEPQSHPVDAHNQANMRGLTILKPLQTIQLVMVISVR